MTEPTEALGVVKSVPLKPTSLVRGQSLDYKLARSKCQHSHSSVLLIYRSFSVVRVEVSYGDKDMMNYRCYPRGVDSLVLKVSHDIDGRACYRLSLNPDVIPVTKGVGSHSWRVVCKKWRNRGALNSLHLNVVLKPVAFHLPLKDTEQCVCVVH